MSKTYSQIRVSPRQPSFDVTGNKNIVDFEISSGNYDLSQSMLQIETFHVIDSSEAVVNSISGNNNGVYETSILMNDSAVAGHVNIVTSKKSQLIRNGQISSSTLGILDNAVDHNSFRTNFNSMATNDEMNNNETEYGATIAYRDRGFIKNQPMQVLNCQGNITPKQRSNILNIPLKDVFPACSINNWQSSVYGDLNVHLELRLETLQPQTPVFPNTTWAQSYNNGKDTTNGHSYGAMVAVAGDPLNIRNITTLITMIQYKDMADCPFHVGQKLNCNYKVSNAAAVTDQIIKIASVEQLNTDDIYNGHVKLTLDCNLVENLAVNLTIGTINMRGLNPTSVNLDIRNIQLNLMEVTNPDPIEQNLLSYDIWNSHKDNFNPTNNVSQNFYIPPLCKACFISFPEALKSISSDAIKQYRIIIDNEPVTESVVVYKSGKHFNLLQSAFKNAGVKIENFGSNFRNWNLNLDGGTQQQVPITLIGFPVALKNKQQIVQIELEADAPFSGNIQLNYSLFKSVKVGSTGHQTVTNPTYQTIN